MVVNCWYTRTGSSVESTVTALPTVIRDVCASAAAMTVDGDEIDLTNSPWVVRPRTLIDGLGFEEVIVLNDFEAQALAVSALPESGRESIGGGTVREGASRVVVGPGTGLGVAGLVRARKMWIPVAGEGGHVDLGPRTARDAAIWFTTPSARGSEKGTPSSRTSTPALSNAIARSRVAASEGSPAAM